MQQDEQSQPLGIPNQMIKKPRSLLKNSITEKSNSELRARCSKPAWHNKGRGWNLMLSLALSPQPGRSRMHFVKLFGAAPSWLFLPPEQSSALCLFSSWPSPQNKVQPPVQAILRLRWGAAVQARPFALHCVSAVRVRGAAPSHKLGC